MKLKARTASIVLVLGVSGSAIAVSSTAGADPFRFTATVKAQTTLAKLQQTVVIPPGKFHGAITSGNNNVGHLTGTLKLPPATTTLKITGIGLATVTVSLVPTKKVVGTLNPSTFLLVATSRFNIHVNSVKPLGLPVNVVGNNCVTSTPVKLTFSGTISPLSGGSVSGTYTIPRLANCGAVTAVLNAAVAGPGNTFTATMVPSLN